MIFYKDFVLNPMQFRIPQLNISPFTAESIKLNYQIMKSMGRVDMDLLSKYFGSRHFCESGKFALSQILKQYRLKREDEVYIATTTGNSYISGCVTNAIENVCRWSRQLSEKSKLIYVNHEFGVIHKRMDEILQIGLPVIEDMAMSMFSNDTKGKAGSYGDFTIYSLPKFFPLQFGGVIKINNSDAIIYPFVKNELIDDNLGKLASHYLVDADSIKVRRLDNHRLFAQKLGYLGLTSRFEFQEGEIPSVYMFTAFRDINLPGMKVFLQMNGVECSVFYGEQSFFIPVHQNLDVVLIDFIVNLIDYYCNEINSNEPSEISEHIDKTFEAN